MSKFVHIDHIIIFDFKFCTILNAVMVVFKFYMEQIKLILSLLFVSKFRNQLLILHFILTSFPKLNVCQKILLIFIQFLTGFSKLKTVMGRLNRSLVYCSFELLIFNCLYFHKAIVFFLFLHIAYIYIIIHVIF